jgi:hypothetical protein
MGSKQVLTFFIDPVHYLSYDTVNKRCNLLIMNGTDLGNFTLLGDPFVRAFVIAHDTDNYKMGFVAKAGGEVNVEDKNDNGGKKSAGMFLTFTYALLVASIATLFY